MNTEATQEFQWILDDDVTLDDTMILEQPITTLRDSATAGYDLAQNDEGVTEVFDFSQNDADSTRHSARNNVEAQNLAPIYPVDEPYLGTAAFPPVPEPPVNTAPRPVTIVWGFVIMALGILAISIAAGAAVDLGLVLIWLPAICGIALISAAVFAAVKKSSAW